MVVKALFNKLVVSLEEAEKTRSDKKILERELEGKNSVISELQAAVLQTVTPKNSGGLSIKFQFLIFLYIM